VPNTNSAIKRVKRLKEQRDKS